MKLYAASLFLILGTMAIGPVAQAGGTNDMDSFWAIQRGYGYDKAQQPSAPGALPMGNNNGWTGSPRQAAPVVTESIPTSSVHRRTTHTMMGHATGRRVVRPTVPAR